jgi:predicted Zn-dependent protease
MRKTGIHATAFLGGLLAVGWLVAPRTEAQIFGLSEAQEMELGREAARQVEREQPILRDEQVAWYVNNLGQGLASRSGRNDIPYRFVVINSPDINAFALPGGFVYVNRGLIEAAGNESELAGVIGHEIGHVVGRHSVEQIEKAGMANFGLGILGALLGGRGGAVAGLAQIGSQVGASAAFMKFSRNDEREADRLGVRNLYEAGYNPVGMLTFFRKLGELQKSQPGQLETFFSTHPNLAERVGNVSREIRSLPHRSDLITDTPEFQGVKQRLTSLAKPVASRQRR